MEREGLRSLEQMRVGGMATMKPMGLGGKWLLLSLNRSFPELDNPKAVAKDVLLLYSESEVSERQQVRSAVTTQAYQEGILLGSEAPASTPCQAL
jgi:hypothetical protein